MVKISIRKLSVWSLLAFIVFMLFAFLSSSPDEEDLGNGFMFFGENHSEINYWKKGDSTTVYIPPEVLSYYNTTDIILAKQHPLRFDEAVYPRHYKYLHGRDTVYYWYIDKNTKEYVGPLLYSEMEVYLQSIGIANMLHNLN